MTWICKTGGMPLTLSLSIGAVKSGANCLNEKLYQLSIDATIDSATFLHLFLEIKNDERTNM